MKYIFVTGGVVSSLGKGLAAASIGTLLEQHGGARQRSVATNTQFFSDNTTTVRTQGLTWQTEFRASDALEVPATQFACQGLELDVVGLCWGGDFVRLGNAWQVRRFAGTDWQRVSPGDAWGWRVNTYRVLLTRARRLTAIWVPRGDAFRFQSNIKGSKLALFEKLGHNPMEEDPAATAAAVDAFLPAALTPRTEPASRADPQRTEPTDVGADPPADNLPEPEAKPDDQTQTEQKSDADQKTEAGAPTAPTSAGDRQQVVAPKQ